MANMKQNKTKRRLPSSRIVHTTIYLTALVSIHLHLMCRILPERWYSRHATSKELNYFGIFASLRLSSSTESNTSPGARSRPSDAGSI